VFSFPVGLRWLDLYTPGNALRIWTSTNAAESP
jgi:hypothetical protein